MPHPDPHGRADLPTTQWTNVRQAGAEASPGQRLALDELLRRYWPALVAHLVYKKKMPRDRAEDVVQSFVQEKVLQRNLVQLADPGKGRFRTFLLTALDRFAIDRWRKESAAPPGAELPADLGAGPGPDVDDVAWALAALADGVRRMRAECDAKRRADLWAVFQDRALAPWRGGEPTPYQALAERLGLESDKQAANRYVIAVELFRRCLRAALAGYARDEAEAEAEAGDLRRIFSQAGAELVERLRTHLGSDVPEITMSPSDNPPADPGALARLLGAGPPPADAAAQLWHALAAPRPGRRCRAAWVSCCTSRRRGRNCWNWPRTSRRTTVTTRKAPSSARWPRCCTTRPSPRRWSAVAGASPAATTARCGGASSGAASSRGWTRRRAACCARGCGGWAGPTRR